MKYPDEFYTLKGSVSTPSNSFSFTEYEALRSPEDVKTNNYSNLILTKKDKTSNWLQADTKDKDSQLSIVTTMMWIKNEIEYWLYFNKTYEFFDTDVNSVDYSLKNIKPESSYSNYVFYIEFIDSSQCRISHTFSDIVFYLCVDDNDKVVFQKEPENGEDIFFYNIQGSLLKLTKYNKNKELNILRCIR